MQWFEEWFDTPYYHILYSNRDYKEAENFLNLLTDFLNLEEKSKIIDLACGKGRHSVYLNKLGYKVLGLDLSEQSINYDKQFENESLKFRVHDMRDEIESGPVDAVFNLFTSFGYFETEEEDKSVFRSVAGVLKNEGYFVLDFLNADYVKNIIVPQSSVEKENIVFNIKKHIEDDFIIKEIDFEDQGKQFHFFERVKLTSAEKILKFADEFGFELIKRWGDYQLSDFEENCSPRCINLFRVRK
ncbi:SAM-dependent methyltransferase [Epilithonimonas mollis]|uniref:Methyltransferase domain-containing protein n=1 Tax=Epilithonimonas mollis TaxID=216903 RepID=A0A1M6N1B6_9FLAO|nr:class I SAM-dependent methyltransferase [Epilithonimonas mollis]SHJ89448.1 Methyltransferase domain-containing protein [Epilithonimonas mollis]